MLIDRFSFTILKQVALSIACSLLFIFAPPFGLCLVAIVIWRLPRGERLEFLCLFLIVGVFPILGLLPWIVSHHWSGPVFFLSLALLRDFFSWFRPDLNPDWSDIGPELSPAEWNAIMAIAFALGALASLTYFWLLRKRFYRKTRKSS